VITLPEAEPVDSVRPRRLIREVPLLLPSLAFTAGVILDRTLPPPTWSVVGSIVPVCSATTGPSEPPARASSRGPIADQPGFAE
jgi:hypothetical protein